MAAKDETARTRIDNIKADLRSISTCSNATIATLQELLAKEKDEPVEKENVRVKVRATARRKAGTTTVTASVDAIKQTSSALAPKERYVLATEVANATLKTLADALKNPPTTPALRPSSQFKTASSDDAHKPTKPRPGHAKAVSVSQKPLKERPVSQMNNSPRKRPIRRSSSHSSLLTSGPDAGLIATAECARIAFAYLGTQEAMKVLGKDSQELQYENGLLVLIGKLVALGLDSLAIKELRILKKRLDKFVAHGSGKKASRVANAETVPQRSVAMEKESLASLLDFGTLELPSPALPLIANIQIYTLRIIAKLKRPRIVEAAWEYLKLANPSSPANLISHMAKTPNGGTKAARQLESLAQTLLALCPSISSACDSNPLQPSPDTVLLFQHLAFRIRKQWWTLVMHQGNEAQELLEPFAKCVIAFARRSQLSPNDKYKLAESLYADLMGEQCDPNATKSECHASTTTITKTLCSLAQAAGLTDEALRWLGSSRSCPTSSEFGAKQATRLVRIATVSAEALLKGNHKTGLEDSITSALEALGGSLGGSASDLETLFVEVNSLRRTATRLLVACLSKSVDLLECPSIEQQTVSIIASSVRFSARFVGTKLSTGVDTKAQLRHSERIVVAWKCSKSIVDSVLTCCKQTIETEDQWKELDTLLQECLHILERFEEEYEDATVPNSKDLELIRSCIVKLSNAYWAVHLQLRKAHVDSECIVTSMHRSINLVQSRAQSDKEAAHLSMKLEQLGETLDNLDRVKASRKAVAQCIQTHMDSTTSRTISELASKQPVQKVFDCDGTLHILARVLKAYHRSFLKHGIREAGELAFYDDDDLHAGTRGALLEWQLMLYLRSLSRNRQWDSNLNASIVSLAERLHEIYAPTTYPLRNFRLSIKLLHFSQSYPHILPKDFVSPKEPWAHVNVPADSEDVGLKAFERHLKALHGLKSSMQEATLSTSTLRECYSIWETLVNSASSWTALATYVDDVEDWLHDVHICVELLNAKGEEYLALPILYLLVKVYELQKSSEASVLITTLCTLGLQLLRLGYTGKAGLAFAKAEALIEHQNSSAETRLRWCIGYAEYLLGIGNIAKCATIMADAHSIALEDHQFMDLAKPSTTLSGRIRFNRILADAAYVYSLLATAGGSYKEAARHARQSVSLNRRIWAALESRISVKKADDIEPEVDASSRVAFDPLSSMRNNKGMPLVMSVTHEALSGPDFWSLVPALYRALMQHSQVFAHQGQLQEAIFVAEQAEKVASATNSPTLMTDNASWRADCWAQSGRTDKAETIVEPLCLFSTRLCLSAAGYHSALARIQHSNSQYKDEVASYGILEQLMKDLSSPAHIKSLETFSPSIDSLADQISNMTLNANETPTAKPSTRGRKPATKPAPRAASKPATAPRIKARTVATVQAAPKTKRQVATPTALETTSIADQCSTLYILQASFMNRRVLANIMQDDLANALDLLAQAEKLQCGLSREVSHMWAAFKARFAQSIKQIAEDFTVNILPESTIAFPAIGYGERRLSEGPTQKRAVPATSTTGKGVRAKKQKKEDFLSTLRDAREHLVEAHTLAVNNGSNHLFQQICMALGHVTVLLSAVSGAELSGSLHPLYAAYMSEIPKSNALRLTQESVEVEKDQMSRDECLRWPVPHPSNFALASVSDFQRDYVDIIPETWSAVSLALNEARDELYITRFEGGMPPFVLRLPLARHASREMDEEEFSFEDGKRDFDEIIELSDFSTRSAKDMTSREARQQWWTEREALDTRLHELLINMENIWLGGFKGVFSQHERQPALLTRFRKSLENILNQHLPSRRKKSQQKRPLLDMRVLELFVGLGDATDEEIDLDEALMDLIYFVVDILQFNGERNAYDEIDLDAMVVEIHDALRAYHSANHKLNAVPRHTILILDKNLHAFPWESLPCLERLSISRLPSLAALRERLLAARPPPDTQSGPAPGHHIRADTGGTSILNPSGDLSHTLKTLKPRLDELQGPWKHIANRAPTEQEFEDSLRERDVVLYFGHGSGAQYVKSKSVRRLYPGQQDADKQKPGCATTLLFGCSSVHLTENGIYEPSGMLASYLTAGAPAVVGMLWDVTDKDCDRFAVKVGELWGLWPEPQEEAAAANASKTPAKTPAKKAKGKGRVAQLVDEVEGTRGSGNGKKGKKDNGLASDELGLHGNRHRGMGLDEAVREARKSCVLRYLNGAAAVVYGIPVYLE
ncbi:Nn.00g033160.m01.CDS01 [Neocucurbitaria sp. VM-36]